MRKIVSQFGHVIICPRAYPPLGAISGLARIHIQPRLNKRAQPSRVGPNRVDHLLLRVESYTQGIGSEGICSICPLLEGPMLSKDRYLQFDNIDMQEPDISSR